MRARPSASLAACALACATLSSCASHESRAPGRDPASLDVERAEAALSGPALDRFELVALADRLVVSSMKGDAATVARRGELAARLRLRAYRVARIESDGREAIALFDRALEADPARCRARVDRATLLGELERDPGATARLLRDAPACATEAAPALALLGPYAARAPSPSPPPAAPTASNSAVYAPPSGEADFAVASPEPPPPSAEPVRLTAITPYGDKEAARIVVALSGSTSFSTGTAPPRARGGGPRVFVDVARARLGKGAKREVVLGGLVERVRMAPHGDGVRVVLDLEKQAFRRIFYLTEPFRVVIDVSTRASAARSADGKRAVTRVALDPGHGGADPGAIGAAGLREKDVTLDIAHRAAPVLARELGVSTLLTRDKDDHVSLEERTQRANAFRADLFISIHCNASESPAARGVQTYVLDSGSDDVAARVAARENATTLQAGREVSGLLASLKLADTSVRSTHLAELLQRAAVASLGAAFPGTQDGGVKRAGFYVLVGAEMPAALFETSFISHPTEEARLGSGEYRQRLADAIVNAVRAYKEGR
ncbi:MAG: N-acetylmuramoyl-L-alanine amidase [Polyangiaceae bacterium]|nr:N-acetylmuramoyl-L-alanine amidase [Polyangiaceae bacterium]